MGTGKQYLFPPFRLDPANQQLWCGDTEVYLRRKTFEVLRYLVEHRAQLVSKAALLDAVWPEIAVSDSMPAICITELRKALGDDVTIPRFVETVHGRGYRFIAPITITTTSASNFKMSSPPKKPPIIVGREAELARMRGCFSQAVEGERRIMFVAGEAGIGKTAFVNTFLEWIVHENVARIAVGQCVEHFGAGEAYMPVLEALTRLGQETGADQLREILNSVAPSWLIQMPALLSETDRKKLQLETQGISQQRMLREIAQALEALTTDLPLVLVLEDLHWSDFATIEMISAVARRTEPTRLLIIGTYRPFEMLGDNHPLHTVQRELELHRQCEELRLRLLSPADIADYLRRRFLLDADKWWLTGLAGVIHERTEGNPLFIVDLVDHLVSQGLIDGGGDSSRPAELLKAGENQVPRNIRQLIERNLERLSYDEQRTLEAASIAGAEFTAAAVAAALDLPVSEIETTCVRLSRREQFIQAHGDSEWPDGTLTASFEFQHALYQEVLCERVPAGQRAELHRRIAAREESAYGERAAEIAAELAHHWRRGNEKTKAVEYLGRVGQQALQRAAYADAISNFSTAIELLQRVPDTPQRDRQELVLQLGLGPALVAAKGYSAPEVEHAFARAQQLCDRLGDSSQLFHALFGMLFVYLLRFDPKACELAERLQRLAQAANDSGRLLLAHAASGNVFFIMGDLLSVRRHFETAISLYDPERHRQLTMLGGDVRVNPRSVLGQTLWSLGYPDQALKLCNEACAIAQSRTSRHSQAYAEAILADVLSARRDARATQQSAERLIALSSEQDFPLWLAVGTTYLGWAIAMQGRYEEGIALIRKGSAGARATGTAFRRLPDLFLLADACIEAGQLDEAMDALTEAKALVVQPEHRFHARIELLKGKLLAKWNVSKAAQAENCFRSAIEITNKLDVKMIELQATIGLARLLDARGSRDEARAMLSKIRNWFTEGFDTVDLKEAQALLEGLSKYPTAPAAPADLNGPSPRTGSRRGTLQ
jgi:DNA-binding winged helix-turn-helix (wHTH) protein/tetratricopeptide (TPR) repeat protein